jgi:hypothetical protein
MRLHQLILRGSFMSLLIVLAMQCNANQTKTGKTQNALRLTGTYSDMYYNVQGGDVLGTEIRIVNTRKGFQGVIQFSEGAPEELVVVDIQIKNNAVSFVVPEPSPYAGEFTGTISDGILRGEFRYKSGGSSKVELKKGKSYWD